MVKPTILIIGAGCLGKALLSRLAGHDFRLLVSDIATTKAIELVQEIKCQFPDCELEAMECTYESAWEADIIFLALEFEEQIIAAEAIRDVVNQKILITMSVTFEDQQVSAPSAESQLSQLQGLLPNTNIIQLVNELSGLGQFNKADCYSRVALAGTNENALAKVAQLLGSVGIQCRFPENLNAESGNNSQAGSVHLENEASVDTSFLW